MNDSKKTFDTINAAALMEQEFEPLQFGIEKILPHGLFILAGSGKIGKSWLALDMCAAVSSGGKLWEFSAEQGEVLYLALEDNHARLQGRLMKTETENADVTRLHLAIASFGISNGLLEQTHNFLAEYPDTKMIIVDTLERIRDTELDKSMYSSDYRDMTALREITNRHNLTLLLIHHTRKMYDPDPLNTLSGSTGLIGSVDGVFVLEKDKRTSHKAKLTIANRDTEGYCFKLEFNPDKCKWLFMGNETDTPEIDEPFCLMIAGFMKDKDVWRGTATELSEMLNGINPDCGVNHLNITKKLNAHTGLFKERYALDLDTKGHDGKRREIFITRREQSGGE
jgi:RecA-family ATPase